jgi:small subunit ribosomal protein S20
VANIKSSKKRILINEKNRIQNRIYKSLVKTYTKKYFDLIQQYKNNPNTEILKQIQHSYNLVYSKIDKALKKNVFHKKNAARKKSQIGSAFNKL